MPPLAPKVKQAVGLPWRVEEINVPRAHLPQSRGECEDRNDVVPEAETLPDHEGHAADDDELNDEPRYVPAQNPWEKREARLAKKGADQVALRGSVCVRDRARSHPATQRKHSV